MKYLFALLALCSACFVTSHPAYVESDSHVKHLQRSTIEMVVQRPDGTWAGYCTGFFVDASHIATAAHCTGELMFTPMGTFEADPEIGTRLHYITYDQWNRALPMALMAGQSPHGAWVSRLDLANDVALLTLDENTSRAREWLTMATVVHVGEHVYSIGHPTGLPWTLTDGIVSQVLLDSQGGMTDIQTSSMVWFGNSGGPLVNDQGQVIGVAVAIRAMQAHLAFATPIRYVQALR